MSASLVGSEMCIRDRPGPLAGSHGVRHTLAGLTRRLVVATVGDSMLGTVSYTHLTLPTICSV
eukprot:14763564-Alexandrium_andersonii.AAC.1